MGLVRKHSVVRFKDSQVCILLSQIGNGDAFNKEFSRITSEGYELKATHPFASFTLLGTGGDTDHLFYFQKSGNSENPVKSNDSSELIESYNTDKVKFCIHCGTSNEPNTTLCKTCGRGFFK